MARRIVNVAGMADGILSEVRLAKRRDKNRERDP